MPFFLFLMTPVILFIASVIALPEIDPERKYDMRAYFFRTYRWMYALMAVIILLSVVTEYALLNKYPLTFMNLVRAVA